MRPLACVLCTALCLAPLAAAACKEQMHPPPESVSASDEPSAAEPAPHEAPAKVEEKPQPSAAESQAKSASDQAPKKEVTSEGYEVIRAHPDDAKPAADVAVKAPPGWEIATPPDSPDPHAGNFTLQEAVKGLPAKGSLAATIRTTLGTFHCELFDDTAPKTVANFVGLARGLRKFWSAKDHAWVAKPYYDGTIFHRVIPEFMIQGGDWKGDGSGNMYFTVPDEITPTRKHDRGGLLCMANRGPNTNEAQFFITEAAAAHLDSSYTIFGECSPVDLVKRIARVPQSGPPNNRPLTPVVIEKVSIERRPAKTAAAPANNAGPVGRAVDVGDSHKPAQ
jgi:peptidyl-prolyl cis-trans isomerase A (cyclophilin A)